MTVSYFISNAPLAFFPCATHFESVPFLSILLFSDSKPCLFLLHVMPFFLLTHSQQFSLFSSFLCLLVLCHFLLSSLHPLYPILLLSFLLPPPLLSVSVPKALGSQQWIITHLRNWAHSVLLAPISCGIAQSVSLLGS